MKKDGSILYLILVFSLVNLIALLFSSQDNRHSRQQAAAEQKSRSLPKPAVTTDVYLPSAMTFAGETVPLHRLDVREALQKELIVNTYLHSHTIQLLKNAPRIFAVIEPILKEAGIPDDFKYLAVIESNLNPSAVSPANKQRGRRTLPHPKINRSRRTLLTESPRPFRLLDNRGRFIQCGNDHAAHPNGHSERIGLLQPAPRRRNRTLPIPHPGAETDHDPPGTI